MRKCRAPAGAGIYLAAVREDGPGDEAAGPKPFLPLDPLLKEAHVSEGFC